MRLGKLAVVLVVVGLAAAPSLAGAVPATARHAKPKPDLTTQHVTASLSGGQVSAAATIKDKGAGKAKASVAAFTLSGSTVQSLGTVRVGKVKPHKVAQVDGVFALPAGLAPGSYHVLVCADSADKVKEKKETNNCATSAATITVPVTVSAVSTAGGTVAASAVSGGTCAGLTCTLAPGSGAVTFTPTPADSYRFQGWSGSTCTGYTAAPAGGITFTNPTADKACVADFVRQVTVSWSAGGSGFITQTVTASATGGSCTTSPSASGTCTVDAQASTVTLQATAGVPGVIDFNWMCGDSINTTNTQVMITDPTASISCVAHYTLTPP